MQPLHISKDDDGPTRPKPGSTLGERYAHTMDVSLSPSFYQPIRPAEKTLECPQHSLEHDKMSILEHLIKHAVQHVGRELWQHLGEKIEEKSPAPKLSSEQLEVYLVRMCEATNKDRPKKLSDALESFGLSLTGFQQLTYRYKLLAIDKDLHDTEAAMAKQMEVDLLHFSEYHGEFEKVCRAYGVTKIFRFEDKNGCPIGTVTIATVPDSFPPSDISKPSNLNRWKLSGEPERWVAAHHKGWNHQEWLELLATLRKSQYWPMYETAIGQHLEMLREHRQA
jgi:hypothetical protein